MINKLTKGLLLGTSLFLGMNAAHAVLTMDFDGTNVLGDYNGSTGTASFSFLDNDGTYGTTSDMILQVELTNTSGFYSELVGFFFDIADGGSWDSWSNGSPNSDGLDWAFGSPASLGSTSFDMCAETDDGSCNAGIGTDGLVAPNSDYFLLGIDLTGFATAAEYEDAFLAYYQDSANAAEACLRFQSVFPNSATKLQEGGESDKVCWNDISGDTPPNDPPDDPPDDPPVIIVPAPATLPLIGLGLLMIGLVRRFKIK